LEKLAALFDDVADVPGLPTFHRLIVTRRSPIAVIPLNKSVF
jgi:hypothetical protein